MNNPAFYYNQGAPPPAPPQMAGAGRSMPPAQMGAPPPPPHYMQQQPPYRNMPPGPPGPDPATMHRKRMPNKPGTLVEDNDEPSGDELDDISARDIAMARYKRNHDYLSEIFTPYSAASIVPPPLEVPQSKEDLEKAIENEDKAIRERTAEYEERLKTLQQKQDEYWNLLKQLDKADSVEQLNETAEQFKNTTGIKLEHVKENVHAIPIPGLEQDEPPVPQPMQPQRGSAGSSSSNRPGDHHQQNGYVADFMNAQQGGTDSNSGHHHHHHQVSSSGPMNMFGSYAPSDSNTNQPVDDDSQNDFFDEMVNTGQDDDGGSVSEFLNADMDFEQTTTDKSVGGEPSNPTTTTTTTTTDVTMTEANAATPSEPLQPSSLSPNKETSSSDSAAAATSQQLPPPTATTPSASSVPEASVPTPASATTTPSAPAQAEPAEGNPQA